MDAIAPSTRGDPPILFDPLSEEYLFDPYPFFAAAAAAAPAFFCETIDHWIVTRYHDVRHILRTPALTHPGNFLGCQRQLPAASSMPPGDEGA
jgi:cytochrome P450